MKRTLLLLTSLVLFSLSMNAQNCNSLISDEAGVVKNTAAVERGANTLIAQGADVHVVTIADLSKYGVRLADAQKAYESHCPTWLDARGHRKANLFVMMIAMKPKPTKNVFFGEAYQAAFVNEDTVNTIYGAAVPYFKHDQFGEGFGAALNDFGNKVVAYHDQQKHPIQNTTTVNQAATDYSGLWRVLTWMLVIGVLTGVGVFVFVMLRRRKEEQEAVKAAQQSAVQAQQRAAAAFRRADSTLPGYAEVAARYTDMSNSLSCDPNEPGQGEAAYSLIAREWRELANDIDALRPEQEEPKVQKPRAKRQAAASSPRIPVTQAPPVVPAPIQQTEPTVVHHYHETVVNNNSNDLLTGMLIGEAMSEHHEHVSRRDDDDDDRRRRDDESSRSSYSSGSDSSWGSSSSSDDSSSSFSSGSDSSWSSSDSGSSFDSGGSFGGGSDSSW